MCVRSSPKLFAGLITRIIRDYVLKHQVHFLNNPQITEPGNTGNDLYPEVNTFPGWVPER
jgi:hypothetical protein